MEYAQFVHVRYRPRAVFNSGLLILWAPFLVERVHQSKHSHSELDFEQSTFVCYDFSGVFFGSLSHICFTLCDINPLCCVDTARPTLFLGLFLVGGRLSSLFSLSC